MKVYLEYDDHHNAPIMETYESEDEAVKSVMERSGAPDDDVEMIHKELFDPEEGSGEFSAGDKWIVITEEHARERSEYWDSVAEAIRAGKDAPV